MTTPTQFIPNLIDEYGRPLYLPVGSEIPDGAVQVSDEVFAKITSGAPRVYRDGSGNCTIRQGYHVWAPTFDPGEGWTEVTDPDEYQQVLDRFNG